MASRQSNFKWLSRFLVSFPSQNRGLWPALSPPGLLNCRKCKGTKRDNEVIPGVPAIVTDQKRLKSEVHRRGWRGGSLARDIAQKCAQNQPPELCPSLLPGDRQQGGEKRWESLDREESPRTDLLCPPTPFQPFWLRWLKATFCQFRHCDCHFLVTTGPEPKVSSLSHLLVSLRSDWAWVSVGESADHKPLAQDLIHRWSAPLSLQVAERPAVESLTYILIKKRLHKVI